MLMGKVAAGALQIEGGGVECLGDAAVFIAMVD